jgi:hypothetical protein
MTKKDYKLIADAIREVQAYPSDAYAMRKLAQTLSDKLAQENPRFDRAKFLAACGF